MIPSKRALVICALPCLALNPKNTPRAFGSRTGDLSPIKYGRKIRPSEPKGIFDAFSVIRLYTSRPAFCSCSFS